MGIASEEEDEPCLCSTIVDNSAFSGDYAAVFDPLDGSSNIDSGLPTGSIFGIYKKPKYSVDIKDVKSLIMQRGMEQVVAGYCLYSSSTNLVITIRNGVNMFTLDDVSGEFYLTKANIKMPAYGNIYSFNDANFDSWPVGTRNFIHDLRSDRLAGDTPGKRKPSARYMGAFVADAHNILLNGGIFGYPGTVSKPQGKLRLVYEANPLALIIEEAGGRASDGYRRLLMKEVADIHQRTPLFIGSSREITALEKYQAFYSSK